MSVLLWIVASYVVLSGMEYIGHRWIMHGPKGVKFRQHAVLHHGHYFPRGYFLWQPGDDEAAHFISIGTGPMPLWTAPVSLLLLLLGAWHGAAVLFTMSVFHGVLWTMLHREMHFARRGWLERSRLFRFWYAYHRVHHDSQRFNFNGLMPLFDHLCGTYQRPA